MNLIQYEFNVKSKFIKNLGFRRDAFSMNQSHGSGLNLQNGFKALTWWI